MTFTNEGTWDRMLRFFAGIVLGYAAWVMWPGDARDHLTGDRGHCVGHRARRVVRGVRAVWLFDKEEGRRMTLLRGSMDAAETKAGCQSVLALWQGTRSSAADQEHRRPFINASRYSAAASSPKTRS